MTFIIVSLPHCHLPSNEPVPVCWWLAPFVLGGGGHYWWHGIAVMVFVHGGCSQTELAVRMMVGGGKGRMLCLFVNRCATNKQ